jgi:ribosomal protein L37AE/L43A
MKLLCPKCKSESIVRDASAAWNADESTWELVGLCDNFTCDDCNESFVTPEKVPSMFFLCDQCEHYHPEGFDGDCRDDDNRFTAEELDDTYGEDGWTV